MKIGFVGCGAIGSCYASYLSREHEVCVLDTYAPVIESIKKNGILVDECVPGTARPSSSIPPWRRPTPRRSALWIF